MNVRKLGECIVKPLLLVLMLGTVMGFAPFVLQASAEEDFFEIFQASHLEEPLEVPDFSLPSVDDGVVKKLSDFQGEIVLLNFWATWCPYCRVERPTLQTLYETYKEKGVVVLSISIDQSASEPVKEFINEHELTFPNLHDQTAETARMYGVPGVPTTFFINREGKAVGGVVGPREWDSKEAYGLIEQLLSQTP